MSKMTDAEHRTHVNDLAKQHRLDALEWAKSQSDAEVLNILIDQRNILEELQRELEVDTIAHKTWDKALTDELLRRMAEQDVKSFDINNVGKATLVTKRNFSVDDPDALFEFVVAQGSIAVFGTSVKKAEIEAYEKEHGELPQGISCFQANNIRITRK